MKTKYAGKWRRNIGTKLYIHRSQIRRLINVVRKGKASVNKRKQAHQ